MSPFEKLSDKALLLLINQIREEFVDNDVDSYNLEEFLSSYNMIETKVSYFGIDNLQVPDITYLFKLFSQIVYDEEDITELPPRPQLKKLRVEWSEDVTEYNRYYYQDTVESYYDLSTYEMEVLRSEEFFDPWSGKMYHKEILDSETTEDECTEVREIE